MAGGGSASPAQPQVQRGNPYTAGGPGRTYFQQNPDVGAAYAQNSMGMSPTDFAQQHYQQYGQYENRSDPSQQFYQPVYQPQYTNYTTTNPLGVSQYNQPMTAQSLVDSAYAGIGRYGSGNNVNQVDPAGRQYWNNQLNSGALNPGNFFGTFTNAVSEFGRQNPTNAYSQYVANQPGYSGGFQNFAPVGNPYQMTTPFNPYTNSFQSPFAFSQQPQTNYGPAQQIVSRSAAARGTPNVMRRAEGGIASLVGDE